MAQSFTLSKRTELFCESAIFLYPAVCAKEICSTKYRRNHYLKRGNEKWFCSFISPTLSLSLVKQRVLSSAGSEVKDLTEIFQVSANTVYGWLNRWEGKGIVGLRDLPGRGRKPILGAADLAQVKQRVQANAQQLRVARVALKADLEREFSDKTLRRYLKNLLADIKDGANV